ncbi:hypothetical protein FISHEDRAFT_74995 [Fistulina hepatica ATCC 64428]|uniref:Uncharacterized protein n=1 Tax=Fistulina hepatica ATCC 64428 TaxID=1128425 RepID=A0A0D7A7T4_9AGAR|nr:hypothetical protein FISHEDRAFT_74995 [Fistulina hepatica ATCC 64428]
MAPYHTIVSQGGTEMSPNGQLQTFSILDFDDSHDGNAARPSCPCSDPECHALAREDRKAVATRGKMDKSMKMKIRLLDETLSTLRFKINAIPSCHGPLSSPHSLLEPVMDLLNSFVLKSKDVDHRSTGHVSFASDTFHTTDFGDLRRFVVQRRAFHTNGSTGLDDKGCDNDNMCVVFFMEPGVLCWSDLSNDLVKHVARLYSSRSRAILSLLEAGRSLLSCSYAILTDGVRVLVTEAEYKDFDDRKLFQYAADILPLKSPRTTRRIIAALLLDIMDKYNNDADRQILQGAMPHPNVVKQLPEGVKLISPVSGYASFDKFVMQRNRPYFIAFLLWTRNAISTALSSPVKVGSRIPVDCFAFERQEFTFNIFDAHGKPRIPIASLPQSRMPPRPSQRQRSRSTDEILNSGSRDIQFVVSRIIKTGKEKYSQVYFGYLKLARGPKEPDGTLLCLKVFDERLFSHPELEEYDDWFQTDSFRLSEMWYSPDLVRAEHATYTRLAHLQGTFIPHYYGAHQLTLADGHLVYGILMEVVNGPSAVDIDVRSINEAWRYELVTRVLNLNRLFLRASVEQADWNAGQIIFPNWAGPTWTALEREAVHKGRAAQELALSNIDLPFPDIVFIDFAFCNHRVGDGPLNGRVPVFRHNSQAGIADDMQDVFRIRLTEKTFQEIDQSSIWEM